MKLVFKNATWLLQETRLSKRKLITQNIFVKLLLLPLLLPKLYKLWMMEEMLKVAQSRDVTVELSEKDYKIIFGNK
jgi:hypothetical protein